ncbi:MAG: signal peptidase II [Chloroflexi bacterium]|nr:signal peptidase II [Chloroflexota bacterium]
MPLNQRGNDDKSRASNQRHQWSKTTLLVTPWVVGAVILMLDQISKQVIVHNAGGRPFTNLGDPLPVLRIEYVRNTGVAFSLFQQQGILALLVPLVLVGVIVAFSRYLPHNSLLLGGAEGMIVGGAISNLIDRFRQGYVVDFIGVHVGSHYWPFFNVADSAITVGVVTLAVFLSFRSSDPSKP